MRTIRALDKTEFKKGGKSSRASRSGKLLSNSLFNEEASFPCSHSDGEAANPMRSERSNANRIPQAPSPARLSPWKGRQSISLDHRRVGIRFARECCVR